MRPVSVGRANRQSGKNSADVRMAVDALHVCHAKGHEDAFVIIRGDSDFSPSPGSREFVVTFLWF